MIKTQFMKPYSIITLTIILFSYQVIHGQSKDSLLKIGDKAPRLKVYKWVKGLPVAQFKKGQTYVVDFGATWCVPCAAAIPHITNLAKKFGNKLNVVGVFVMEPKKNSIDSSYVQNVMKYVEKQGDKMEYNVAVDDPKETMQNTWLKAAALDGIPQVFIIDKNGLIAWMGNPNPVFLDHLVTLALDSSYKISDAIEGGKLQKQYENPSVDPLKPLFIDGNGGDGKDFLYRSILTRYSGEKSANSDFVYSTNWDKNMVGRQPYAGMVQQIGAPLSKLYYLAYADTMGNSVLGRLYPTYEYPDTIKYPSTVNRYGKFWYTPIFEVSDTLPFQFSFYANANRYNYSLIVPDEKASAKFLQEVMRRDLKTYFGYDVSVEDRMMPYWKLIATDRARTVLMTKTPGNNFKPIQANDTLYRRTNAIIKDILEQNILSVYSFGYAPFGRKPKIEAPFFDETGITGEIDYEFSDREFQEMRKGNWDMLLQFLHRLGLDLIKGERLTKVVVIRDPK